MKRNRYYTAIKTTEHEWEHTDKRGYGNYDFAVFNAIELSKRNGGTLIGILHKGEIKAVYFNGKIED